MERQIVVDDVHLGPPLDEPLDAVHHLLQVVALGPDGRHPELRALPRVVVPRLPHRHLEGGADPVREGLDHVTLLLQRSAGGDPEIEPKCGHQHQEIWRATPSTSKAPITSPSFTSLEFSSPIPHSKPSRTSATSSLNRRREPTRPS